VDGVKKLGLRGAAVGASVAGDEFSDPKFHPFCAQAEELGHPGPRPSALRTTFPLLAQEVLELLHQLFGVELPAR
jgi:hypothetical protein